MPSKRTRKAADDYLAGLNRDPKSASYRKLKSNLGRLVNASPTFPVKPQAVEEALGDPATVSVNVRMQRYDHLNRFFKSPEVQALGFPNPSDQVQRPRKGKQQQITTEAIFTRGVADRHLEIIRQDDNLSVSTLQNYRRTMYRFADVVPTLPPDGG